MWHTTNARVVRHKTHAVLCGTTHARVVWHTTNARVMWHTTHARVVWHTTHARAVHNIVRSRACAVIARVPQHPLGRTSSLLLSWLQMGGWRQFGSLYSQLLLRLFAAVQPGNKNS